MKIKAYLLISIVANVGLLLYLYVISRKTPPPFNPFHVNIDFTRNELVTDGYTMVPVDVEMLGKTIGSLTMHYQIDEETGRVYWREGIIDTNMKELDTVKIYNMIEGYDADILLSPDSRKNKHSPPLSSHFFVRHRINHQIFECFLEGPYEDGYHITIPFETPIVDPERIKKEKSFWKNYGKRFGSDTIHYDNGQIHIENFWDWTQEGEDIWLRKNGTVETIRIYKNGELQRTRSYYENGTLEFDVLAYNQTGSSSWWYPDGTLQEVINYRGGARYGFHTTYYASGSVKARGQYSGGYYDTGIKNGDWNYYDSLGTLLKKETYKDDSLVKVTVSKPRE